MTPKRLSIGPLPADLATELRNLTTNAQVSNLSPEGDNLNIEAPFTGETIGWVGTGSESDVDVAFEKARRAQRSWVHVPHAERKRIFLRFHDLIASRRELLADMVQLETGKNRTSAMDEVLDVMNNARYYAQRAEKILKPQRKRTPMFGVSSSRQYHQPLGVVGQISPWNYPLTLGISDAIPAFLAGNGVVAKPDSATPFTALLAFSLLFEAGLPRDLAQIVTGPGRVVGTAIAERCDYLMFTGSTKTGKILGETAGKRLIGYSAELGGKNPLLVAADANVDHSARDAIEACFSNSGQLCVSIERMYVARDVYEEFVSAFTNRVKAMTIGPGFDWNVHMGSLISQDQLRTVQRFVDDAVSKGATVVAGGKHRPDLGPYFYEPTVLTNVPEDADLRDAEVFGPVVYIDPVDDMVDAVARANDTAYGLNACIFAAPSTARQIAPLIQSGTVGINDGYMAAWTAVDNPMGGMKESGMSSRHGESGLLKYTAAQNVTEQRLMSVRGPEGLGRKAYSNILVNALRLGKTFRILP